MGSKLGRRVSHALECSIAGARPDPLRGDVLCWFVDVEESVSSDSWGPECHRFRMLWLRFWLSARRRLLLDGCCSTAFASGGLRRYLELTDPHPVKLVLSGTVQWSLPL